MSCPCPCPFNANIWFPVFVWSTSLSSNKYDSEFTPRVKKLTRWAKVVTWSYYSRKVRIHMIWWHAVKISILTLSRQRHLFTIKWRRKQSKITFTRMFKSLNSFEIKNMCKWHDLYVCLHVSLLANVMKSIRHLMMQSYDLELCHYISLPMLVFDCCLKKSGITELLRDPTMHCWIESGIRGGYVSVGLIWAAATNNRDPYMRDEYDETKPTTYSIHRLQNNCTAAQWVHFYHTEAFNGYQKTSCKNLLPK